MPCLSPAHAPAGPPGLPEERQPVSDGRAALPGTTHPALGPPPGHAHPAAGDRRLHHDQRGPQVEQAQVRSRWAHAQVRRGSGGRAPRWGRLRWHLSLPVRFSEARVPCPSLGTHSLRPPSTQDNLQPPPSLHIWRFPALLLCMAPKHSPWSLGTPALRPRHTSHPTLRFSAAEAARQQPALTLGATRCPCSPQTPLPRDVHVGPRIRPQPVVLPSICPAPGTNHLGGADWGWL